MVRLSGELTEVTYTKLDVIERHIIAAMQMIAMECNPFSTHIVVKAGQELITSIAEKRGVLLDWDHRLWIKDEYHREYKALANKPYNFGSPLFHVGSLRSSLPAIR